MKSYYIALFIILFAITNLYSQSESFNKEFAGPIFQEDQFIPVHSQRIIDPVTLDSIITTTMASAHYPGLTALIVKHDSIVWSRNYGYADIEHNRPVEDSTLFLMASISKTIMATAIMQLWEDGLFDLDDNINNYLPPGFQVINPYFPNDPITFKMLMTHTSSIRYNWDTLRTFVSCGDSPIPLDSFLINYLTPGGLYYHNFNFYGYSPSTNIYNYTNVGASVLAYLVYKLSGISFDQYCRENIFNPLEMNCTSWFLEGMDTTNIATPYEWIANQYYANCHQGWPIYPSAFLRTNKIELGHFMSAYINRGTYNGISILESTTVDTMLSVHKYVDSTLSQGLIWRKRPMGPTSQRHLWGHTGGWEYGTNTWMAFDEEEDWGFIFFINKYADPLFPFFTIAIAISDYAAQYGDIYAVNSALDKPYMKTSDDSILVRSQFSNFNQHDFTANAIYINSDSSSVDSLALYDDGLHGDSLSNDGVWGGFIHSIAEEDYFSLGISTSDTENGKYFYSEDLENFTTVGPVVLFGYEVTSSDTTSGVKDTLHYVLTLQNQSNVKTVTNISTTLKNLDTSYQVSGVVNYGNIAPGETSTGTGYHTVIISNQIPPGTLLPVEIRINSNGVLYWLDTLDIIITETKEVVSLPRKYSLWKNYPNPFNPSTNIKFSIPRTTIVEIKVFDILGREIETLVNEEKPAGTYKLKWNAENLSSGVYFYRMRAGSPSTGSGQVFVETKKMLLLK